MVKQNNILLFGLAALFLFKKKRGVFARYDLNALEAVFDSKKGYTLASPSVVKSYKAGQYIGQKKLAAEGITFVEVKNKLYAVFTREIMEK